VEGLTAEPIVPGAERVRPGSFHDLIARYYRSPDFLDPGERTREVYRGVIERWRVKYGEALVRDLRSGCDEAGLSHCSAHGLRKAAARRFAEAGCSNQQIKAWTGHVTDVEVSRYTAAADQTLLSDAAAELLMANLRNRLANPDASALERKA